MTKTLDEVTELDLTQIFVEVTNPETPFGGVQVFGSVDAPIQVVFGDEPGAVGETPETPETPEPPTGEGIPGPQGPPGPQGVPGEAGPTGPPGDDGTSGAAGPQGIQGEPGATGAAGDQGVPGAAGPQGVQGVTGPAGPKGADGTSVSIKGSVANSAALPPSGNTPGDLWITLDTGHGWVWGLPGQWSDIGPIQGPPGATGAAGAVGAQGPAGATGPQGTKGDVGSMGPQGAQGVQGAQGPKGNPGTTGATGATGAQGIPGPTGATGPQGNIGATGNTGAQGVKGDPGATGATGPQGPQGVKGDKGDLGNTGYTGPQGALGPAGPGVAAGGALGAILHKKSATDYDTEWKTPANLQSAGAVPALPTTTLMKMCGMGGTALITPAFSGKLLITISCDVMNPQASGVFQFQGFIGTGSPPAAGAAVVGTRIGFGYPQLVNQIPFTIIGIVAGLPIGTQHWIDMAGQRLAGAGGVIGNTSVTAVEIP